MRVRPRPDAHTSSWNYETASGLSQDLKRHLENEPAIARPPSTAYRLRKAWQRNKVACTSAAAVLLALATGATLAAVGGHQALTQRDAAVMACAGEEMQRKQAQANENRAIQERRRAELAGEDSCQTGTFFLAELPDRHLFGASCQTGTFLGLFPQIFGRARSVKGTK